MGKLKKLVIELTICCSMVGVCGVYALLIWGKTSKKASEGQGVASTEQIKAVKVYTGVWHKDYLEVVGK